MTPLKKILIPTDFSEDSLQVIDRLKSIGLPKDAKILLLHVLPENLLVEPILEMYQKDDSVEWSRETEAQEYLKAIAAERMAGYERVEFVVRRGDPAAEIVKLAEHDNVGLIVMSTHGRTGMRHLFFGSVAERVVRTSHVPVLTSRPPELRQPGISAADVREQLHLR